MKLDLTSTMLCMCGSNRSMRTSSSMTRARQTFFLTSGSSSPASAKRFCSTTAEDAPHACHSIIKHNITETKTWFKLPFPGGTVIELNLLYASNPPNSSYKATDPACNFEGLWDQRRLFSGRLSTASRTRAEGHVWLVLFQTLLFVPQVHCHNYLSAGLYPQGSAIPSYR